jgi:hypothetical protein
VGAGPIAALDEAALRQAFDGKFFAHVKAIQAALPQLRGDGSVTLVTAASARATFAGTAGIAAANGALDMNEARAHEATYDPATRARLSAVTAELLAPFLTGSHATR